jgi:hypothetical protein
LARYRDLSANSNTLSGSATLLADIQTAPTLTVTTFAVSEAECGMASSSIARRMRSATARVP